MTTGVIRSKVRGVSHKNPDGTRRQHIIERYVKVGQSLIVKPEPENPYGDGHAIGLWIKARVALVLSGEFQIGYISSELSEEMTRYLNNGGRLEVVVTEVTGGGKKNLGVNIEIRKK